MFWRSVMQFLLAGLAAHLAAAWAADDPSGILAASLSRSLPRWEVVVERAAAATLAVAVAAAAAGLATWITAAAVGAGLPAGRLASATALLVPFALAFAAVGAAAGGRWPRAGAAAVGAFALASFLYTDLETVMGWPSWVGNLSVFRLYGSPLTAPVFWTGLWVMLAIVVVGFGLALWGLRTRDVA